MSSVISLQFSVLDEAAKKLVGIDVRVDQICRGTTKANDGSPTHVSTPDLSHCDSEESRELEDELKTTTQPDRDIEPIQVAFTGEPGTIEPTTGIAYPRGLNSYSFVGCGVRTKYLVFHAYAVGLYILDNEDASVLGNVKTDEDVRSILLDPTYPKLFRLVMNRNVTSSQYIGATFDALTPLMRGKDMDKLEEMKTQEMPTMLPNRTEIYLMVNGSTLTMQLGTDRAGVIESAVLTSALCENYLGDKPVSPAMKKAVMMEMDNLRNSNNQHCK